MPVQLLFIFVSSLLSFPTALEMNNTNTFITKIISFGTENVISRKNLFDYNPDTSMSLMNYYRENKSSLIEKINAYILSDDGTAIRFDKFNVFFTTLSRCIKNYFLKTNMKELNDSEVLKKSLGYYKDKLVKSLHLNFTMPSDNLPRVYFKSPVLFVSNDMGFFLFIGFELID